MTNLTTDQLRQLNMYSIYVEPPEQQLFTLEMLLDDEKTEDALNVVQAVSGSPNRTVAASYFMRRFGMFTAMQFYNLAAYDEVWDGNKEHLHFWRKRRIRQTGQLVRSPLKKIGKMLKMMHGVMSSNEFCRTNATL